MTGKERYQKFLESGAWRRIRQECFAVHGEDCKGCGSFFMVQAHHLFYPKVLEETEPRHLLPLCWKCHKAIHVSRLGAIVYREEFVEAKRSEVIFHLKSLTRDTFREYEASRAKMLALKETRRTQQRDQEMRSREVKQKKKRVGIDQSRMFLERAGIKKLGLTKQVVSALPDLEIQRLLRERHKANRRAHLAALPVNPDNPF